VQSYTPFSINDYQSFTAKDTPADVAVAIILMMAAGIPAYGTDFGRLSPRARDVVRWHHALYAALGDAVARFRTTDDPSHGVLRLEADAAHVLFVIRPEAGCTVTGPSMVLNGAYAEHLVLRNGLPGDVRGDLPAVVRDEVGDEVRRLVLGAEPTVVAVPPGGSVFVGEVHLPVVAQQPAGAPR
jgi:hypothetical protein